MSETRFRDRYAVQRFKDGGIVIDLSTGDYVRLKAKAGIICDLLVESDEASSAVAEAAKQLGITGEEAARAIETVVSGLANPAPRRDPVGAFHYSPAIDGTGYLLSSRGLPRLWVSLDGSNVRAIPNGPTSAAQLYEYVRAVAPKLLFLQGATVMHGAGCVTNERLRAFCGESGAGKTTTARAFGAAGGNVISEDLLLLASASPLTVYVNGEKVLHGWARTMAERLGRTRSEEVSAVGAREALSGERIPVKEIWLVDAERRHLGEGIHPRALPITDAAVRLMSSLFLGARYG